MILHALPPGVVSWDLDFGAVAGWGRGSCVSAVPLPTTREGGLSDVGGRC